ncbi:MAG: glutamine--tRNA ligase, partial [Clostridia bacterium]|nr:glutamine--tRNA ligase [Clostridia bacterium]
KPRQIEFARLNITNTVMSKRYLKKLVEEGTVGGWDDPRMPTLSGLRNRGIPAEALKNFCEEIGVAKANSEIEVGYFEHFTRDYLNRYAPRAMAVFDPIKVIITNYEGSEEVETDINPNDEAAGKRKLSFSKEVYIDGEDFSVAPPPKYFRLKKDGLVRLKGAYVIRCDDYKTDDDGNVTEIYCTYLPETKSGSEGSEIKVKGTIQWVDAENAVPVEIRKYDYLLKDAEYPGQDFSERINENSLTVLNGFAERYIEKAKVGESFQLMRKGYYKKFISGPKIILSEIVSLKDSFKK